MGQRKMHRFLGLLLFASLSASGSSCTLLASSQEFFPDSSATSKGAAVNRSIGRIGGHKEKHIFILACGESRGVKQISGNSAT